MAVFSKMLTKNKENEENGIIQHVYFYLSQKARGEK